MMKYMMLLSVCSYSEAPVNKWITPLKLGQTQKQPKRFRIGGWLGVETFESIEEIAKITLSTLDLNGSQNVCIGLCTSFLQIKKGKRTYKFQSDDVV